MIRDGFLGQHMVSSFRDAAPVKQKAPDGIYFPDPQPDVSGQG